MYTASYKAYRAALRRSPAPCIPYLGLYLTELSFIGALPRVIQVLNPWCPAEEANPAEIYGLINFQKHALVARVVEGTYTNPYDLLMTRSHRGAVLPAFSIPASARSGRVCMAAHRSSALTDRGGELVILTEGGAQERHGVARESVDGRGASAGR